MITTIKATYNGRTFDAFTVLDISTGDQFGNHTYQEACRRAQAMTRNWQYKKKFIVIPLKESACDDLLIQLGLEHHQRSTTK